MEDEGTDGAGPRLAENADCTAGRGEALRDIRPWREVGWIFKDGDALAIERQGDRTRQRAARVVHQRDE
jgi:hypothetical protein